MYLRITGINVAQVVHTFFLNTHMSAMRMSPDHQCVILKFFLLFRGGGGGGGLLLFGHFNFKLATCE